MNKLLAALIAGLFATSVFAQAVAPSAPVAPATPITNTAKTTNAETKVTADPGTKTVKAKAHHKVTKAKTKAKSEAKVTPPVAKVDTAKTAPK